MNIFVVAFTMVLEVINFSIGYGYNIIKDENVSTENPPDNKYFIIVKQEADLNGYDKIDDQKDNKKEEYFLLFDKNIKPVQRRFRDLKKDREERKQAELLKTQQERKIKEITDFMTDHQMTTNFLYEEVKRIKRERIVKDDLRRMVEYLEKPGKSDIRAKVLKCYQEARKAEVLSRDIWGLETNNLVLNVLKDPYNHGYIN